jgi:hypothetical protein
VSITVARPAPAHPAVRRTLIPVLAGAGAASLGLVMLLPAGWPWTLGLVFLVVPLAELALAPVWRVAGVYRYHAPLLFSVRRGPVLELHAGSSYDYLLRFRWHDRGPRARRIVLRDLLSGLLAVAAETESGSIPGDTRIIVDSHVIGERTARAFGFETAPARWSDRVHLVLDIVAISVMHGFVRGRPAVAPVWRARRFVVRPPGLAAAAPRIRARLDRLERRS